MRRVETHPLFQALDHREIPTIAKNLLRRQACFGAVDDRHDLIPDVDDRPVRRF
jgi:hypothetical protein